MAGRVMGVSEIASRLREMAAKEGGEAARSIAGVTLTLAATATSDSKDGRVDVRMDGSTATQAGDGIVTLPCVPAVKAGQRVSVTSVNGHDTVTGVIGWGDDALHALSQSAEDSAAARDAATKAKESADRALDETRDLVTLRIDSSRGTTFKNSEISTVLSVRCYKRGQEITTLAALRDAMGDQTARIRWWVLREGDTSWVSLADSDHMLSDDGFTLTITPADVDVKCTFKAEIVTD